MSRAFTTLVWAIVAIIIIITIGVTNSGRDKETIIYEQARQLDVLNLKLRDLEIKNTWLLLFKQGLPETTKLRIYALAESIKQDIQKRNIKRSEHASSNSFGIVTLSFNKYNSLDSRHSC